MTKLGLAMIFAKDVSRMAAFYQEGLGLRLVAEESSEGWVVFDAGATRLALHAIPEAIASTITIADPPEARSGTPIKLVFETDDLDGVSARLIAKGGVALERRRPTSRDLLDPEGNVIQLTASAAGDDTPAR